MKVIAIANQKGGVGKTTTATALASVLSKEGYKTLLIDADTQCNATDTYRGVYEEKATLYDILFTDAEVKDAIQETEVGHIVPGDPLLRECEIKFGSDISLIRRLQRKLKKLDGYDYVIIDTAPNIGNMLISCILASDAIIVPVTADRYALAGLDQLKKTIDNIEDMFDRKIPIEGFLLVKFNERMNLSKETREALFAVAKNLGTRVFNSTIRESSKAREAQATRRSLYEYAPNCTTAMDYYDFCNELLEKGV